MVLHAHGTHAWDYEKRIKTAECVASKRESLSKSKLSDVCKRNKLLNFIKEQNSRQEYHPPLGKLIDNGYLQSPSTTVIMLGQIYIVLCWKLL